jgi:hypothetical protein
MIIIILNLKLTLNILMKHKIMSLSPDCFASSFHSCAVEPFYYPFWDTKRLKRIAGQLLLTGKKLLLLKKVLLLQTVFCSPFWEP